MKTKNEFEELKEDFNKIHFNNRSVWTWNIKRNHLKNRYSPQVICALDASGYIHKWLRGDDK
jgi:hypothetical protein